MFGLKPARRYSGNVHADTALFLGQAATVYFRTTLRAGSGDLANATHKRKNG
jgi:hypothetical protein